MILKPLRAGCAALALMLATLPGPAPGAALRPASQAALATCFEAQSRLFPFSGVVLARRGSREMFRTAGSLDPDRTVPIARDRRFKLASVSKVFTRVAIGRLADEGRLSLDAAVGTYLPNLPPAIAAVTLDQLLQHTSGVASLTRPTPEQMRLLTSARTARELLPLVMNAPLDFRPGERQRYSNGGFLLLGAVVEAVSGRAYETYLRETLFRPLRMSSTSLEADARTAVPTTRMAGPGQPPLERPRALPDALSWRGSAAGDAVSTADDLARLGEALIGNRLLSPAVKNRLFPRQGQFWRIGQSGGNIGTNADLSVLPESGWTLVVLSNFDPPAAETMAEVLRGAATGQGCRPVGANERRSPFGEPPSSPPPGAPSAPGVAWEQSGEARANGWIDAFNSGDAAVLESFAEANYSAAALARRTADERRAVFRDLQAQAGRVTVTSLQAVDGELRVRATDRNGREIAMAFRFEPVAPYRIEGVSVDAGER